MKKQITIQELKYIIKEEIRKIQRRTILESEKKALMEELEDMSFSSENGTKVIPNEIFQLETFELDFNGMSRENYDVSANGEFSGIINLVFKDIKINNVIYSLEAELEYYYDFEEGYADFNFDGIKLKYIDSNGNDYELTDEMKKMLCLILSNLKVR